MRISFFAPARVTSAAGVEMTDASVLRILDGWSYEADSLDSYLDIGLAKLGIIGGTISFEYTSIRTCKLTVDFSSPAALLDDELAALTHDVRGQLQDGIGENGFRIAVNGTELWLTCDARTLEVDQVEDGRAVPGPPTVAIAAMNGDCVALSASLKSGGSVDEKLLGYSALQLAILYGKVDAALLLIEEGANVNFINSVGATPLLICATSRTLEDSDAAAIAHSLIQHEAMKPTDDAVAIAESRGKLALAKVLKLHVE